jgi:hypothetical protein
MPVFLFWCLPSRCTCWTFINEISLFIITNGIYTLGEYLPGATLSYLSLIASSRKLILSIFMATLPLIGPIFLGAYYPGAGNALVLFKSWSIKNGLLGTLL